MEAFRWHSVVASIILGFGLTRSLTSLVFVFRARARKRLDWIPLVWAATIFVQTLLFWWTLGSFGAQVPQWSFGKFLFLVTQVLALFLASALILPTSEAEEGETLRSYFEGDGRWSLVAVALFNALAIAGNYIFLGLGLWSPSGLFNGIVIATPMAAFLGGRRVQIVATALHAALMTGAFVFEVPLTY